MREKKLYLIITFHTTAAAIAMEKLCREKDLPGRLIPVPRELTADCGMAYQSGYDHDDQRIEFCMVGQEKLEAAGFYEVMI